MPVAPAFARSDGPPSGYGFAPPAFGDGLSGDGFSGDGHRRPRRIALFTGNYVHIPDGVSLTLNRLVRYLRARGDEVLVFAPTVDDPMLEPAGRFLPVPSVPFPARPEYRFSVAFPKALQAELEAFRPDLVHIASPDYVGVRALRWAKKHRVPVVSSYHTHFASYLKYYRLRAMGPALWTFVRWFYNQFDEVYVPSSSVGEVLEEHGITAPIRLWSRGIEAERFTPASRTAAWREHYGFRAPVVTFVGRLVWEKGLDVLADVIERLEREGVPHHSLIVGDGPAREVLEARLTRTLFAGHLDQGALATAYASSDVFLFPSETETFGNVTLEAMASGLPTVCADAPGSRSLVADGRTGYLCPPGDVLGFADAVAGLVRNDAQRARMGAAARRAALAYEWDTIMGRLMEHYDEVVEAPAVSEPVLVAPSHPVVAAL